MESAVVQTAEGWELDVERGPDWLIVRPHDMPDAESESPQLAHHIWALLEQNFTHRLLLELDQIGYMRSYLIGQLVWLYKRIHNHGGVMRICGLSEDNQAVLRQCRLEGRFPPYISREEAVMGSRPGQPR